MKSGSKFGCFVVILFAMIISAVLITNYISTQNKVNEAGGYVLKALKTKYKKDFVIDSGHYISNTGGYEFKVYPKNDPDFTFNAWLNGMTESGESDEYFIAQRFYEAINMVKPYIDAISEDSYFSAAAVEPDPVLPNFKEIVAFIYDHKYTIEQMVVKYPYKISISLQIHINYNITPTNENSIFKKVYKLVEFLKEKKFGKIEIWLLFYDYPNKSIKKLGKKNINFSIDYQNKAKYWLWFDNKDEKNIKKWQDLKKYFGQVNKKKEIDNEQ